MLKELFAGISHFLTASSLLSKHKLLHYYFYPVIIGLVYYFFLISSILMYSKKIVIQVFGNYIPDKLPEFDGFLSFLNALGSLSIYSFMAIAAAILMLFVSSRISKYVILILLSPFFSLLSEKVEEKISGKSYDFNPIQFIKEIWRGIVIAIRNLCIELFLVGLLSVMALFAGPLAFLFSPLCWLIGIYFTGFSMIDYICERRKMSISEGVRFIRRRKMFAIGNGLMYTLLMTLPFIGIIIAPVNAICGAVSGLNELEKTE